MKEPFARQRAAAMSIAFAVVVTVAGMLAAGAQPIPPTPPYLKNFPNFAPQLTPPLPGGSEEMTCLAFVGSTLTVLPFIVVDCEVRPVPDAVTCHTELSGASWVV